MEWIFSRSGFIYSHLAEASKDSKTQTEDEDSILSERDFSQTAK
jgi:hypothetical protein